MSGPSSQFSPSQVSPSTNAWYDSSESRAASVSSMRKTRVPPWWRAKAQLNRAVRINPTCGVPVGDGQNRTRTAGADVALMSARLALGARARSAWSAAADHRIAQHPDALDVDLDGLTVDDRPHTGRGAGQDHIARQQGHHLGDPRDDLGHGVDQRSGVSVLDDLTVTAGDHGQVRRIQIGLDPRSQRAERVMALAPGPLP